MPGLKTLPRWILPLFALAMTVSLSLVFIEDVIDARSVKGRIVCSVDSLDSKFENENWDDLCYIPRINIAANGHPFSDPWNSSNDRFGGWGTFGLAPEMIGGTFVWLFGNYFQAMLAWSIVNFFIQVLLVNHIFVREPFRLPPPIAILITFVFLSYPWMAAQPLNYFSLAIYPALGSHIYAQTDIEAGLFTYLAYAFFLLCYWRLVVRSRASDAVIAGASAGLLTYVYYYHYIFAFAMLAVRSLVRFIAGARDEAKMSLLAVGTGLIVAVPFFINNAFFFARAAAPDYLRRLALEPGRMPFEDYRWLLSLTIPVLATLIHRKLFRDSPLCKWSWETLSVLALAFFGVLNLRVFMGFGLATDHYWRQSLATPATLWVFGLAGDVTRRMADSKAGFARMIVLGVSILPFALFTRAGAQLVYHARRTDPIASMTEGQKRVLAATECVSKTLQPGEGFLAADFPVTYSVTANLRARPFVPMGLSPDSLDEATDRYAIASYLTAQKPDLQPGLEPYAHVRDPELYLYINEKDSASVERLAHWDPDKYDWGARAKALSSVKSIYLQKANLENARVRIEKRYRIESSEDCGIGIALRVRSTGLPPE